MFASFAAVMSVLLFVFAAAVIRRRRAVEAARALASVATAGTTAHDAARNRAWVDMMTRSGQIVYIPENHTYREANGFRTIKPPYGTGATYATA